MNKFIKVLLLIIGLVIGNVTAYVYGQGSYTGADSILINSFPSIPFLPDPLIIDEGGRNIPVKTIEQWEEKKTWIRDQYQRWISGYAPPAPRSIEVKILKEEVEDNVRIRLVELHFGPQNKAKMTVELIIPSSSKPLPVFLTQWNHRDWAQVAVERGYIGCIYAGADAKDDTKDYDKIFPGYDFSLLMKRAWGASRVIDYLYRLPEVDTARIGITGHSRNGKQSLRAAAFDERIKAVVSSSAGTGGEIPFRMCDDRFVTGESIDLALRTFPQWYSPRLRLFEGKEQKLPVDQNSLMSLIAPRGLMTVTAITEHHGNPWGAEQSYRSVKKVYHFLKADSSLAIWLRQGRHQHAKRDIETYLDFFDYVFGQSKLAPENKLYFNYSFDKWKQNSKESIDPLQFPIKEGPELGLKNTTLQKFRDNVTKRINWLLGNGPLGIKSKGVLSPSLRKNSAYLDDYLEEVIPPSGMREDPEVRKMPVGPYSAFSNDLWGNIYIPSDAVVHDSVVKKLPLVIYLHGYSYATGYHMYDLSTIREMAKQGFAVIAFDMVGFGTRIEEALHFYDRYPHWSKMGMMVKDTRNIINDACTRMPFIDSEKIYLVGYSLGGTVALFTAALDERVKGVAMISAFSSLRYDNVGTEGIKGFSELHGLIPKLGFFIGHEDRIPIDYGDVLACVVPRSLLIISPVRDRDNSIRYVRKSLKQVIQLYQENGMYDKIRVVEPNTYNHFSKDLQNIVINWLGEMR